MWVGVIGGIGLLGTAVMVWLVTRAAATGDLASNSAIGIRTAATTASEEAWRRGHHAALPATRFVCAVSTVAAAAMFVAGILSGSDEPSLLVLVLFSAGYVFLLGGVFWIARVASRGARLTA